LSALQPGQPGHHLAGEQTLGAQRARRAQTVGEILVTGLVAQSVEVGEVELGRVLGKAVGVGVGVGVGEDDLAEAAESGAASNVARFSAAIRVGPLAVTCIPCSPADVEPVSFDEPSQKAG